MIYLNDGVSNIQTLAPTKARYVPDVSRLMSVCELSYARLLSLIPDIRKITSHKIHVSTDRQDLGIVRFDVLEQSPYTTALSIHQPGLSWADTWEMEVRIYHDAKMAEVIKCQSEPRIRAVNNYPNERMHRRDEKMQLNIFLAEWLHHCLDCGHIVEKVIVAR